MSSSKERIIYTAAMELYLKPLLKNGAIRYETYYDAGNLLFDRLRMQQFKNEFRPSKGTQKQKQKQSCQYPNYVCLTQLAKQLKQGSPNQVITGWLNKNNTREYIELWRQTTNCTDGIITRRGYHGGTYVAPAIAYYFMVCMSPETALQFVEKIVEMGVSVYG